MIVTVGLSWGIQHRHYDVLEVVYAGLGFEVLGITRSGHILGKLLRIWDPDLLVNMLEQLSFDASDHDRCVSETQTRVQDNAP